MENLQINASSRDDIASICLTKALSTVETFMAADYIVLDASALLEHRYVDKEGIAHGIDSAPFWRHVSRCAAAAQAIRYPGGEDRLLQIPESCVVEIAKKADSVNGDVPGHLVDAARIALKRLDMLLHERKLLTIIPDADHGGFGDSALCALAMNANSRQRLLFITQDRGLGRDLLRLRELECFRTRHEVYGFDQYGFLCPIPSDAVAQPVDADIQTAPVC